MLLQRVECSARCIIRYAGIVIALDPDPVTLVRQLPKAGGDGWDHAGTATDIMKAVAQTNHSIGPITRQNGLHPVQRCGAVVGRQQSAAFCERRAFLEMEIGKRDQREIRQDQRAGVVQQYAMSADSRLDRLSVRFSLLWSIWRRHGLEL